MNKKLQPLVLAGMIFANTLVPIGQVFADDEEKSKKINYGRGIVAISAEFHLYYI